MKHTKRTLWGTIAAFALVIVLALTACDNGAGGGGDKTYAIGDTGPGGGKIFYVSEAGFTMTDNGQVCRYLEAAPQDVRRGDGTSPQWCSTSLQSTSIPGTGEGIGTGRKNTALMLAADTSGVEAAKVCKTYSSNGKSDWFLPSKDELARLYANRDSAGTFDGGSAYWSSTEYANGNAWEMFLVGSSSVPQNNSKSSGNNVRPVRAF